uniref:RNA-directed DNA polymerase n=1 Tax=Tanacetum cinerariifolium TaxID=118510 RepID=A0A6L2LVZ9_TANCI|nr:reverse transcriptase domain-containing protein [Tanacetum cinerariifolium]
MQTRSSSRLVSNPSLNLTSFTNPNPKGCNHRRSKQRIKEFNLDELSPPIVTIADQRTTAQLLQATTEGYEDAIVVPTITADNFELTHGLLTLFPNVPNTSIKLMLFPFSLEGATRIWLEKEPPRSIFTWDGLVSKFINQFFPPSITTNLRNEITNSQQCFDKSFSEAWDRFKDLLRACPHHGFSELHQLDTFYNALISKDQDSLNSAAGGNFLDKMPRECLAIIESKSKVRYSRNKPVVTKVSTNTSTSGISPDVAELMDIVKALLLDKKGQNQSPAPVKAIEESCVTCGDAHSYCNCPATDGNVYRDNIQEFVSQAFAVNYNQGNTSYRPSMILPSSCLPRSGSSNTRCFKGDFLAYVKANDAVIRNLQTQGQNMKNQLTNLTDLITKFVNSNSASTSSSGTLPSNIIANMRSDFKAITTRSGVSYDGPQISPPPSFLPKVVEDEPKATKVTLNPTNNGSTKDVQPLVVQSESTFEPVTSLISEPVIASVNAPKPNPKYSIPYPSKRNDKRNHEKANNQIVKFYQIFKDMSFEISFADALILMPKFASTLKALIGNKEKLSKMARTPLNEHCSAVLLKKLPEKLGDPSKFLIPCDFPGMAECLALADLGASNNLMTFSVWKRLSLPDLTPMCMTLELADRLISHPVRVAEDVYVKVGSFHFLADFVVIDFDADPRVPLIIRRSFLKIGRALIDVFEGELTLHVGKEAITFNLDQTSRYSANYNDMTARRIDVIDMACEEYSQEVLGFCDVIANGNPTLYYDPIVSMTSSTLTLFGNSDFLLEEVDAFLENDPMLPKVDQSYFDSEGDILLLEAFLNIDPSPPPQGNYLPQARKELKIREAKSDKSSVDEPQRLNSKTYLPTLNMHSWKGGFTVVENEDIELIPTRLVMGWRKPHSPAHTERLLIAACLLGYAMLQVRFRERMLKRCEDTNLCLNWEKSHFMVKKGIVLGHKISKQGIEVDKEKVDVITKLPHPTTVKGIRSFLGHASFYRHFINDFSKIAKPMTRLLEKDTPFIFSQECVEAFQTLKRKLTKAPILIALDWDMPFKLMCDASDFAIGAVLGQRQDKYFRPIHYASKTMTEAESNYTTTEKEMLAMVYSFEKFRSYLVINKSIVYTDHFALKYLFDKKDSKARLLRWVLLLQEFTFKELNKLRDQAYEHSLIYKEKTKRHHDSKIKDRVFNNGDRVLLFNSRLKIFSGKLKSRWSRPFTISQVYPYGTVELSQPDGPNFKVNGHRIKHYFGEDVPKVYSWNLKTHAKGFCPPVVMSAASFGNHTTEGKIYTCKALDTSLVDIESSGTESKEQDTSSRSGNDAHADDVDIRPVYDEEPMDEEKGFAIAALKNKLRKLTGNSVNTKFANSSILGKPVLQPYRNQLVFRQPIAFKSVRPRISKSRFTSQVDVNNDLSKPVTTHYLPKEREVAYAKPHHVIASNNSRNSSTNMPRFSSNDMVHNHNLEEAKKHKKEVGIHNLGFKEFKSDKQAMTFDHNSSELRIYDHSNEASSSKLVPKVVPPAD